MFHSSALSVTVNNVSLRYTRKFYRRTIFFSYRDNYNVMLKYLCLADGIRVDLDLQILI